MLSSISVVRLVIATVWVAILLVTHGIWTATALPLDEPEVVSDDSALSPGEVWVGEQRQRRVDIYGNEVEDAVVDYRIDVRGDLYERHAPQTALPKPKRPDA
jgi:hypothetical protein